MSWVRAVDSRQAKAAMVAAGMAVLIPLSAFVDSRYTHATDFNGLESLVQSFVVDGYEMSIDNLEDEIAEYEAIFDHLTQTERKSLSRRKARRAAYLRKLERLKTE